VILIDSSLWIEALRHEGPEDAQKRLASVIEAGEAAWCAAVRLELWIGIRHERERMILRKFNSVVSDLEMVREVWEHSIGLAECARRRGYTFPYVDLLIFSCAKVHRVELLHRDRHFDTLARL
jgi:predicted nucleic acid-binding protein